MHTVTGLEARTLRKHDVATKGLLCGIVVETHVAANVGPAPGGFGCSCPKVGLGLGKELLTLEDPLEAALQILV